MRRLLVLIALTACNTQPDDSTPDPEPKIGLDANGDGVWDGAGVDWSTDATVPAGTNRVNLYGLADADLASVHDAGLNHANVWPVTVSGLLLPYEPIANLLSSENPNPDAVAISALARQALGFGTMDEMYAWLGLPDYNDPSETGPFHTPIPPSHVDGAPMGVGVLDTQWGGALTFSCATCHTANVFGRTVVGLTNRSARANEFFHLAAGFFPSIQPGVFEDLTGANATEMELFTRTQDHLPAVGAVTPQVLGLDTSLAQVALSLSRRGLDDYATRSTDTQTSPRQNALSTQVADSKPAVWWGLKYKTRWLADGSIVSGNPIFTNFLWNEIGRGTDLHDLEDWMKDNQQIIDELTVAVFSTTPPSWDDFFPDAPIDEASAMRGETVFEQRCSECHGHYEKAWSNPSPTDITPASRLRTLNVYYHDTTPVMDVSTDPMRAAGMQYFAEDLNRLAISHTMGAVVVPQAGYVPPPLDGVWMRYPYLHNGSVTSLCALLSMPVDRPALFYTGPADDPDTDFDFDCIGLPTGDAIPASWKAVKTARYDTTKPGLSNAGHYDMLLDENGDYDLSVDDRTDLIAFLKTL